MGHRGHVPIRTCVVCGDKKPRSVLVRLIADPVDGLIAVDREKTCPGRGAHVCEECLPRLRMNPRLRKAFRHKARGLRTQG